MRGSYNYKNRIHVHHEPIELPIIIVSCMFGVILFIWIFIYISQCSSNRRQLQNRLLLSNNILFDQIDYNSILSNIFSLNINDANSNKYLQKECPICLEKLNTGEIVSINCNHLFHKQCILNWSIINLQNNKESKCPLCNNIYLIPDSVV